MHIYATGKALGVQVILCISREPFLSHHDDPKEPAPVEGGKVRKPSGRDQKWANDLRDMYKSVLDEPLPDSFTDLLRKLDQADDA
jgi:hypothetical protein